MAVRTGMKAVQTCLAVGSPLAVCPQAPNLSRMYVGTTKCTGCAVRLPLPRPSCACMACPSAAWSCLGNLTDLRPPCQTARYDQYTGHCSTHFSQLCLHLTPACSTFLQRTPNLLYELHEPLRRKGCRRLAAACCPPTLGAPRLQEKSPLLNSLALTSASD